MNWENMVVFLGLKGFNNAICFPAVENGNSLLKQNKIENSKFFLNKKNIYIQ